MVKGTAARPAAPTHARLPDEESGMGSRILRLIATVTDRCGRPHACGPGRPPADTVRVLATLRRFLREGTPWRSLHATAAEASGSTLRRSLARWAGTGLLARMHAMLVGILRGHPDLILDSCSVRAKRGGIPPARALPNGPSGARNATSR
jgi:transposase